MSKNIRKYFPIFMLPTLLAFVIGFIVPFALGVWLSFCKFTTVTDAQFVGLSNYIQALKDPELMHSFLYTTAFVLVTVVVINVFAFAIAFMLTKKISGSNFFRSVFFMPNLIGGIILGWIWQLLLNGILAHWGKTIVYSSTYGFWGMVILLSWQQIGYMMVIYIAGLQNIPGDYIEAARVDGANKWQLLRHIILPGMMPSITICTFLTVTNGFKMFDQNLALTNGAPSKASELLAMNIFNTFYGRNGFEGVGQAKAVIFFIVVAIVAVIQNKLTTRKEVQA